MSPPELAAGGFRPGGAAVLAGRLGDAAPWALSRHAAGRIRQRGIRTAVLELILSSHDGVRHVGGGCRALFITRRHAARLRCRGLPAALLEAAIGVVVVVDASFSEVVTALHAAGTRGRRYRAPDPALRARPRRPGAGARR